MNDRYIPTGEPLTEREAEIIDLLIEEASEVIHAASKLKRFGKADHHPERPEITNTLTLGLEIGDLLEMIHLAKHDKLIFIEDIVAGSARKHERLKTFSKTLP